jgi:hypothetical protein
MIFLVFSFDFDFDSDFIEVVWVKLPNEFHYFDDLGSSSNAAGYCFQLPTVLCTKLCRWQSESLKLITNPDSSILGFSRQTDKHRTLSRI